MAAFMKRMTIVTALFTVLFTTAYHFTATGVFLSLAITAGTTFYHFAMRLFVGWTVDAIMKNHADYTRWWYRPHAFEEKIYKALQVHRWKDNMPTYNPALFTVKNRDFDSLCQVMCQAEVVHECIIPLSFVPMLASLCFGTFPVFLITSLLAAALDLTFVILQRYNRPRIMLLAQRQKQRTHP